MLACSNIFSKIINIIKFEQAGIKINYTYLNKVHVILLVYLMEILQ